MLVATDELVFAYGEGGFDHTVTSISQAYSVGIEVVSTHPRDASGFPFVRLYGTRENVKSCLLVQWEDGGGQMNVFAEMTMGNKIAELVWNGKLDEDSTDLEAWWHSRDHAESIVPPF